jgi:hypothetical protein
MFSDLGTRLFFSSFQGDPVVGLEEIHELLDSTIIYLTDEGP